MSNIAGKSYAINVVTPAPWGGIINRLTFWGIRQRPFQGRLQGLLTLSLIHYARWFIVSPAQWPNLGHGQPRENLKYSYEFFFSNFNGSWNQYIDSFSMAIPSGLDAFWRRNVGYPKSVPIRRFHRYINHNQVPTGHYYNAYPLASSNDVKAAKRVRDALFELADAAGTRSSEEFAAAYNQAVRQLQGDLSRMEETPIVSLANEAVARRARLEELE